jgi:hypothetical protein
MAAVMVFFGSLAALAAWRVQRAPARTGPDTVGQGPGEVTG